MTFDFVNCTEEELWKHVASHLSRKGIDAVLVGGSVVSIYTNGLYESGDLDFIVSSLFQDKLPKAMQEIGFQRSGRHYVHPECSHLFVEFPPGPLAIGEETNLVPDKKTHNGTVIKLLSPTDCIKDRLSSYLHFKSRDTLDQAVLVAQQQTYKVSEVKKWCTKEGAPEVFEEFSRLVKKAR